MMIKKELLLFAALALAVSLLPVPGAFAQACPQNLSLYPGIQLQNGLLTAKDSAAADTKFYAPDKCILGRPATVPQFSIPSYDEMQSLYFTQHKPDSDKQTITDISQMNFNKPLYHLAGDLTVSNKINVPNNRASIIFIDGNLTFTPANSGQRVIVNDSQSSGLTFIVGGNLRIDPSVSEIDALLITFGQFCDAWDTVTQSCLPASDGQLTVKGSIIAFSQDLSKRPLFRRVNAGNTQPAEVIVYQPKFLVIFKDIFAKTLQIWSETQ